MATGMVSSNCPHVTSVGDYTQDEVFHKQELAKCDTCGFSGTNMWVCLHRSCLYMGCGEIASDHSLKHFMSQPGHALALNLTSLRVWCYECEGEVFLENNEPLHPRVTTTNKVYIADPDTDEEEDLTQQDVKPRGLTGLQNVGNSCYMNAAIQALSNCPQLTNFFRDCGSFVKSNQNPGLSKIYMRLVKEIWHKRRPSFVSPQSFAYGIRVLFPVFRGFTQQDAQEFLRCFMDQLHEELKEIRDEVDHYSFVSTPDYVHSELGATSEESSQSEAEFETCDSGLSSEKSSHCGHLPGDPDEDTDSVKNDNCELSSKCNENEPFVRCDRAGGDYCPDSGTFSTESCQTSKQSMETVKNYLDYYINRQGDGPPHLVTSPRMPTRSLNSSVSSHGFSTPPSHFTRNNLPKRDKKQNSIISDIFDGKILSSVQCLTCDTLSSTKETFQDLSLPIPTRDHLHMIHAQKAGEFHPNSWMTTFFSWFLSWFWGPVISLQDCLAAFFSADELKGDNMYSCEKCKKLRNGIKYSKVLQLPEVLCIHLKRFRHEIMFSSKISSYVSFPLEGLDLAPFLHKECSRGVTTYDLVAVICHHGTAGSGHYTTYGLNYLNDQWYEFDDQYVTQVDPQTVQNCEAYVLFYRKSCEDIVKKRQRTVELMQRSKNESGLLHFYISKQWVNRFNTFAEPGPISNNDFLCPHGGVHPTKASYVEELCTVLSQSVWEYLHHTFGGGPACSHLYLCPICQKETESRMKRKKQEYEMFVALNHEFQSQNTPTTVYAISMTWFKQWEAFVRNKDAVEPPSPIDNYAISHVVNNQSVLKIGADFGSLSEEMWRFLVGIYGGGPEVIQQNQPTTTAAHNKPSHLSSQQEKQN